MPEKQLMPEKQIQTVRFRAFRPVDEPETCRRYLAGHVQVLTDYGITNITTNNNIWTTSKAVYAVVAESEDGSQVYGGVRVHMADGIHPLPVELAIGKMDPKIYDIIKDYSSQGTGEICGLWNSKEVSGLGVSLILIRAGISIVNQLAMDSLFTICADYTMPMVSKVGFVVETDLGKDGDFIYPNENYIARVLRKMNAVTLDTADEINRIRIFDLRDNPEQIYIEQGPKGPFKCIYELLIPPSKDPDHI
jgi:hypothetical protein